MMSRYLMTQSLLSSWAYAFDCSESNAEEAKESFVRALKREPSPANQAMSDGLAFEREVYAAAAGVKRDPHPQWESGIQKVATIIKGAPTQVKASREIEVGGYTFLVYGILDALKAGTTLQATTSTAPSTRHICISSRRQANSSTLSVTERTFMWSGIPGRRRGPSVTSWPSSSPQSRTWACWTAIGSTG